MPCTGRDLVVRGNFRLQRSFLADRRGQLHGPRRQRIELPWLGDTPRTTNLGREAWPLLVFFRYVGYKQRAERKKQSEISHGGMWLRRKNNLRSRRTLYL